MHPHLTSARSLPVLVVVLLSLVLAACGEPETEDEIIGPENAIPLLGEYADRPISQMVVETEESLKIEMLQLNPRTKEVGETFWVWGYTTVDQEFFNVTTERVVSGAVVVSDLDRYPPTRTWTETGRSGSNSSFPLDTNFLLTCMTVGIGTYTITATAQINDANGDPTGAPVVVTADATVVCVAAGTSEAPANTGNPTPTSSGSANISPDATITSVDPSGSSAILVNGMLVEAVTSQWNGPPRPTLRRSWSEFVDVLSYSVRFSVTDGPFPPRSPSNRRISDLPRGRTHLL